MEKMGIVQARTPEKVKEKANVILDQLGLNMSTYINMALNQLIIQGGVPFAVKVSPAVYSNAEQIKEVAATMKMENMELDRADISMLENIKSGEMSFDEARKAILSEV